VIETVVEFAFGAALFALGYRGITGRWPWERK
jgi:hypothetical protein